MIISLSVQGCQLVIVCSFVIGGSIQKTPFTMANRESKQILYRSHSKLRKNMKLLLILRGILSLRKLSMQRNAAFFAFIFILILGQSKSPNSQDKKYSIVIFFQKSSSLINKMHFNLRHQEAELQTFSPQTELWARVLCSLTLLVPIIGTQVIWEKIRKTSSKFYMPTVPPDFFYRIWIVIFVLFIFIMVYAAIQDIWTPDVWAYMTAINLTTGLWVVCYITAKLSWVNISICCQFVHLFAIEMVWILLANPAKNSLADTTMGFFIRNAIAFSEGWFITTATLGIFIVLVYNFGLSFKKQVIAFWVAAPIVYLAFFLYNIEVIGTFDETIGMLISAGWAVAGALMGTMRTDPDLEVQLPD